MYLDYNKALITVAALAAIVLMVYMYKKDRAEKESPRLLFRLVMLGVVSTFLAVVTETLGMNLLAGMSMSKMTYSLVENFVVVAFSEECFKYIVMKRATWKNPEFNCSFDAVVYAVFVSLGFALWENIGYTYSYGLSTAIVRAFTSIPGHATFGIYMGAYYGLAKLAELEGKQALSKRYRIFAVLVPVLLHGAYDFLASGRSVAATAAFAIFILIMFAFAFSKIKKLSNEDHLLREELYTETTHGNDDVDATFGGMR